MAVNQSGLVEGSLAWFGTLANLGLLVPGMLDYDDSVPVPAYDPDKSRSMVAAAGVSNLGSE
jgi:ABC-type transport system substrate-binding protein